MTGSRGRSFAGDAMSEAMIAEQAPEFRERCLGRPILCAAMEYLSKCSERSVREEVETRASIRRYSIPNQHSRPRLRPQPASETREVLRGQSRRWWCPAVHTKGGISSGRCTPGRIGQGTSCSHHASRVGRRARRLACDQSRRDVCPEVRAIGAGWRAGSDPHRHVGRTAER